MPASQEQQDLLQDIAQALQDDGPVAVGTMFRSPALRTGKKVVAFLGSGSGDTLILKLPRERAVALLEEGSAEPVTIGNRTMRSGLRCRRTVTPAQRARHGRGLPARHCSMSAASRPDLLPRPAR